MVTGSVLMKEEPLSEWMYAGIPKREKSWNRHCMTLRVLTSLHGKTKGNRLYSLMMLRKYVFWLFDFKGPLKSIFSGSKG